MKCFGCRKEVERAGEEALGVLCYICVNNPEIYKAFSTANSGELRKGYQSPREREVGQNKSQKPRGLPVVLID